MISEDKKNDKLRSPFLQGIESVQTAHMEILTGLMRSPSLPKRPPLFNEKSEIRFQEYLVSPHLKDYLSKSEKERKKEEKDFL